jgi:hypothetical protein
MMLAMRGWTGLLLLALVACSAGDDTADGTRGLCAEGGELNDTNCHANPTTAVDACWRMVDCGAIPLHENDQYRRDWDNCVNTIESMLDTQQKLAIACIGASTCDQLKIRTDRCFLFGDN